MLILSFNALVYIIWFIITYLKEKTITLYSFLIGIIAVVSILGVYTTATDIWFDVFGYYNLKSLDIEPYIYTFIGFILFFSPLKDIGNNISFSNRVFTSRGFKLFLILWFFLICFYTLMRISEMYIALSIGLNEVYEDRHVHGNELIFMQYANPIIAKLIRIGELVQNATTPVTMFYAVYLLLYHQKVILPLIILILSVMPSIFFAVAIGSRGAMVWGFFKIIFIFLLVKNRLSKKMKRKMIFVLTFALFVVLVNSIITTTGRVNNSESSESATSSILRYFGEPFPNAGFLYWNNVKAHPMGKRFFPDYVGFKKDIGSYSDEIFEYWTTYTGVPILNWKILYIDCYIEFGKIGGLIFIGSIFFIFKFWFRKIVVNIFTISIVYAYFEMCDNSFTGYNMLSVRLTTTIISIIILNSMLYLSSKVK